jgi:hypothetical protein
MGHLGKTVALGGVLAATLMFSSAIVNAKDSTSDNRKPALADKQTFSDGTSVEVLSFSYTGSVIQIKTKDGKTCYGATGYVSGNGGSGASMTCY